jgi:hypothetical protein
MKTDASMKYLEKNNCFRKRTFIRNASKRRKLPKNLQSLHLFDWCGTVRKIWRSILEWRRAKIDWIVGQKFCKN